MADRSLPKRVWYDLLQIFCRLAAVTVLGTRVWGRHHVPPTGGILVMSNHQSHFDPLLAGLAIDRRLNSLARKSLFKFAPFRWLIESLNAIPIDREGIGLGGIKETLKRLKRGELVLIFPEGTRTADGEIAPLKTGFVALARRGNVPLLPVGIDGAFDAWPRWKILPGKALVHIAIGPPLTPAEVAQLDDDALVAELERRMRACQSTARASRLRANPLTQRG
jgi:1-acyl-sn-glycerol-3-phosphate acyltransferase